MPLFERYIGIDYSGAQTVESSLPGLRVYMAGGNAEPAEVPPPPSPRKYWTRQGLAEWLVGSLASPTPMIVGIDHAFSFPLRYFAKYGLRPDDWPRFLDDFQRHWPTDRPNTYVDFVRDGHKGHGARRTGDPGWRRITETRCPGAKSVFHFDVPGQVAKSTHAGLPWLRYIRQHTAGRVHFWPFDGWEIPFGRSAIVEVYPSLWRQRFPQADRTADQHDAYCVAASLQAADGDATLAEMLRPELDPGDALVAQIEGWILGAPAQGLPRRR